MHQISHFVMHYGYAAVFTIILLEDFGVLVPGESVLVAAGILAGTGYFNIWLVLLVGFVGAVIGDNIGYTIGYFGGRKLVLQYGRYIFIKEKYLESVHRFILKHGIKVVIIARFFNGARQLNGIVAGIGKMPWGQFLLCNILGASLWVSAWGVLAYGLGKRSHNILIAVRQLQVVVLIGIVLIAAGYIINRHFKNK